MVKKKDSNLTLIQVTKETRNKLQSLRLTKRESYDEIINRLMVK